MQTVFTIPLERADFLIGSFWLKKQYKKDTSVPVICKSFLVNCSFLDC